MTLENQDSIGGQNQAAQQPEKPQAQIAHSRAELKPPPPKPECKHPCKEKKHWLDYVTFGLELLGLIVLCIYAAYTIKIYCANKKAADAAKSAADTAASQLELAERPWIDANISIDGPFEFNVNGANVHLKFTLRNTGHSPAQSINIYPLLLIGKKIAKATAYRDQACKESTRVSTTMPQFGMVLFPNAPFEQQYSFGVGKEEIEQEKASKEFPGSKFGEVILGPTVVICLAYRPTFNRTSVYHTAYIVDLFKRTPMGISPLFKIGENVDQKQLFLRLNVMNAISAD
jgi:hypothetical protein